MKTRKQLAEAVAYYERNPHMSNPAVGTAQQLAEWLENEVASWDMTGDEYIAQHGQLEENRAQIRAWLEGEDDG